MESQPCWLRGGRGKTRLTGTHNESRSLSLPNSSQKTTLESEQCFHTAISKGKRTCIFYSCPPSSRLSPSPSLLVQPHQCFIIKSSPSSMSKGQHNYNHCSNQVQFLSPHRREYRHGLRGLVLWGLPVLALHSGHSKATP